MTILQFRAEIRRITDAMARLPQTERRAYYEAEIAAMPTHDRGLAEAFFTAHELMADSNQAPGWEKVAAFASAIGFILLIVAIAIFIPDPQPFQEFTFRLVLTLAAGAFGGFIPGFLNIESHLYRNSLRAGGALGLAVLVYTWNPPAIIREQKEKAKGEQADKSRNSEEEKPKEKGR